MSEDKLLIAVNELIKSYEEHATNSISKGNENALNVLDYSVISNIGSVVRGLAIGDFISIQESVEEILSIEERIEVENYSDCELERAESKLVDTSPIRFESEDNKPAIKGGVVLKVPKKKLKLDEIGFVKNFLDNEAIKKYDFEGCLNCDLKSLLGFDIFENVSLDIEPIFRINELLKSIGAALKEIELSLDSSPLLKNICDLANLWKTGKLCPSLIARVSLFFPILIDKNVRGLIDIGVNLGGLLGVIVSPILSVGAMIGENLRTFFIKIADCILGAIRTIKDLTVSVERSIQNIYASVNNGGTVITNLSNISVNSDLYQKIFGSSAEKLKETKKAKKKTSVSPEVAATAESEKKEKPAQTFSEGIRETSFSWNQSLNNVFSDTSLFKITSEQKRQSRIASELPSLAKVINFLNTLIKVVEDGKAEVLSVIDAIIYALKAFTVFIQEPIFAKIKLLAELKFIFNLIRLFNVVKALYENGFDCSEPVVPDRVTEAIQEAGMSVEDLLNSTVKNKRVLGVALQEKYKQEVSIYDCDASDKAEFEKELDSIYSIIANNF